MYAVDLRTLQILCLFAVQNIPMILGYHQKQLMFSKPKFIEHVDPHATQTSKIIHTHKAVCDCACARIGCACAVNNARISPAARPCCEPVRRQEGYGSPCSLCRGSLGCLPPGEIHLPRPCQKLARSSPIS